MEIKMRFSKWTVLCLILGINAVFPAFPSNRIVIQSAHEARVLDMQWHQRTRTLLSLGEDGLFIVSNIDRQQVLHRFPVSRNMVHSFHVNPSDDKVAILESENGQYAVSVWDWGKESRLYDFALDSEPLFITWSAKGTYLAIGRINTPSIILLNKTTGTELPYLRNLPSLYNAGYIGSTENIIMTYSSSGTISYRDIKTSALKFTTETISGLDKLTVLQTGRKSSMLARKGKTLYLINRQTGKVLDSQDIPGLLDLDIDPNKGTIIALSYTPFSAGIISIHVDGDTLVNTENNLDIDPSLEPGVIAGIGKRICMAIESGSILIAKNDQFSTAIDAQTWHLQSLDFDYGYIYLGGRGQIMRVTSDFFSGTSPADMEQLTLYRRDLLTTGPTSGKSAIRILPNGKLLVWDKDFRQYQSEVQVLDFDNPDNRVKIQTSGPISGISLVEDKQVLAIDQSGTISLYSLESGTLTTSYAALGLSTAAISPTGDFILTGRTVDSNNTTPLEVLNVHTGESLPIPDNRFMVYNIVADANSFYSIGIVRSSENSYSTKILVHNGSNPKRSQILTQYPGSDLYANVAPKKSGPGIYLISNGKVHSKSGFQDILFQWKFPIREVQEWDGTLYGIDVDGSLILWNARKGGAPLLQIQFFKDGAWFARVPETLDNIWLSPEAKDKISVYRYGRLANISRDKNFKIVAESDQ